MLQGFIILKVISALQKTVVMSNKERRLKIVQRELIMG